jgi:nitroreductase
LDVIDAIFSTRSMRRLKPDPVPESIIWELIDAAIRAPNSGNAQRWGWVVVQDAGTKEQIGGWYLEAWNSLGEGRRAKLKRLVRGLVPGRGTDGSEAEQPVDVNAASGTHLANNLAHAPVWIFAVMQGIEGEPTVVDGADVFPAVQNLLLAARKHGLGATLTMLHRRRDADVSALLGLPPDARALALIPIGYTETPTFSTPKRRPVDTVTHWERWGAARSRPERPPT